MQPGDALPLPRRYQPRELYEHFIREWRLEVQAVASSSKRNQSPSIHRVLWRVLGGQFSLAVLFQYTSVLLKLCALLLFRRLVQLLVEDKEQEAGATSEGVILGVALGVMSFLEGAMATHGALNFQLTTLGLQACLSQAVLWKGAQLHPDVKGDFRRGDLVSLALSECSRLNELSNVLMQGIGAPFMLLVNFVLFVVLLGPLTLAPLVVVLLTCYFLHRFGIFQGQAFRMKVAAQGKRLAVLNEMLQSVRFTKYYTLEEHYKAQMEAHRKTELGGLVRMKVGLASAWPLAATVPVTVSIIILMLHQLVHGELPDAADTFAILGGARFLFMPSAFFGSFLGGINMYRSASSRFKNLLLQPEIVRRPLQRISDNPEQPARADAPDHVGVRISGQSFAWTSKTAGQPTLSDLNIEVPKGELWAVVGEIGSGKSSLLAALLGTIEPVGDRGAGDAVMACGSSRVYVPQESMVMNASLRDNVLFGQVPPGDEAAEAVYRRAVAAAALEPDLKLLPAGDATEVGEKGFTLSGGQKARVALARAVLASRPGGLVLLDDPLAAVDAHVGAYLFKECICGALAGTTRLLVTNQLHFLSHSEVARVLVFQDGRIVEQGSFRELAGDEGSRLSRMLALLGGEHKWEEESLEQAMDGTDGARPGEAPRRGGHAVQPVDKEELRRVTKIETKEEGAVSWSTLRFYIRRMGGCHAFIFCCFGSWVFHLSEVIPDTFLAFWQDDVLDLTESSYIGFWLGLSVLGCIANLFARQSWVVATMWAARRLHGELLSRIMRRPTSYFDRTPSGQVMNRFGEDLLLVEWTTPLSLEVCMQCAFKLLDLLAVVVVARPLVLAFVAVFLVFFAYVREVHRRVTREILRNWMVSKSPVFNIFEEILAGVDTVFAFEQDGYFRARYEEVLTSNLEWLIAKDACNNHMDQRLVLVGSLVVGTLAVVLQVVSTRLPVSIGAVAMVYSLNIGDTMRFASHFLVMVEGNMASVERLREVVEEDEEEPPTKLPADAALEEAQWPPGDADLVFEKVSVRYLPHMPRALDGLSCHMAPREKVGIVGRTGSGKSTVMGALFRLFPLEEGRILLAGQDLTQIGVGLLRRQVTIVPQDPILFSGALRRNLDPQATKSEEEIFEVLRRTGLDELVKGLKDGLATSVAQGGSNFSVGERQVLCLTRALLRESRVLCLDEATANVDPTNDKRIHNILTKEVSEYLVLTIAHRLRTVLQSDRILVMDGGRVAQFASPESLLSEPGIFRDLAAHAGITSVADGELFADEKKGGTSLPASVLEETTI